MVFKGYIGWILTVPGVPFDSWYRGQFEIVWKAQGELRRDDPSVARHSNRSLRSLVRPFRKGI
jgi:hypothetical protein